MVSGCSSSDGDANCFLLQLYVRFLCRDRRRETSNQCSQEASSLNQTSPVHAPIAASFPAAIQICADAAQSESPLSTWSEHNCRSVFGDECTVLLRLSQALVSEGSIHLP